MSECQHDVMEELRDEDGWPAYPLIMLLVLPPALSMGLPEMLEHWLPTAGGCRLEAFISADWMILHPLMALVALAAALGGALIVWIVPAIWLFVFMDSWLLIITRPQSKQVSSEIATRAMVFSSLALVPGMLTVLGCSPIAGGV